MDHRTDDLGSGVDGVTSGSQVLESNSADDVESPLRFDLRDLFFATAVTGIVLAVWRVSPPSGYFISIIILPASLGIRLRTKSVCLSTCMWTNAVLAIGISAAIAGCGAAWHTWITEAQGYLVGDGMRSVFAAALAGAIVGFFFALVPMSIQILAEPGIAHTLKTNRWGVAEVESHEGLDVVEMEDL